MALTWLLEADVLHFQSEPLRAEIRRQGLQCHVVKLRPNGSPPKDILGAEAVPPDAPALFMGTIPGMRHVQLHRRWRPGGWFDPEQLACRTYYAHLGPFLLNQRYTLLPGVEALRHADRLFDELGVDGKLFVRPDAGDKGFTGTVVDRKGFAPALAPARYDPTTLVVVAAPRTITREWRLVVARGAVVAASLYRDAGGAPRARGCPAEVTAFAEKLLAQVAWRPDPMFMLDVCEAEGGLHVLELNGFSCSGLYECDLGEVVRAATECARA